MNHHRHRRARRDAGAASLIVVMVLFFIVSMVAAYTSRNLIFEQKTSTNQLRSTMATEAAEGGLQWALGLLNSGRIGPTCAPSTDLSHTTFRQRYLSIDGANGAVTPLTKADGTALLPTCVFNGTGWTCSCPVNGDPAVATPGGGAIYPAFRVRFVAHPSADRRQLVRIEVNGCTANNEDCLKFTGGRATDGEARATTSAYLTLKGAISSAPVAAVTSRGNLDLGGAASQFYNSGLKSSGITINAGGAATTTGLGLHTVGGSPGGASSVVDNDLTLQFADFPSAERGDAMFVATFGMARETYRDQPGAVILGCATNCTSAEIQGAIAQNPGRILWAPGNVNFDAAGNIGSPTEPVAIIAVGNIQFSAAAVVHGLVYSQAATWATAGTAGSVLGAAVGEGDIGGNGAMTISYDASLLEMLRHRTGSFVIVPGTWKDFQ